MSGSYGENARRKPHTPSAIVIGGGFAGLAAADALRNASFQVFFSVTCCHVCVLVMQSYLFDKNEKILL
jgi:NAD(P)H-nitrite reductase large subunit